MKIIGPVVAVVMALALAGCGSGRQHSAASPVRCGLVSCSRGRAGQPCTVAGYPGIIVHVSPAALGCDPKEHINGLGSSQPPPAAPPPVSTAATLSGMCTLGYEWPGYDSSRNYGPGAFIAGTPDAGAQRNGGYGLAYQVTLTNDSDATADTSGFAVVFYDATGNELGSDQEQVTGTFITPGQSLTWTEVALNTVNDQSSAGGSDSNIPADAGSCQFLQWYGGAS